jgi:hypothetical protein
MSFVTCHSDVGNFLVISLNHPLSGVSTVLEVAGRVSKPHDGAASFCQPELS